MTGGVETKRAPIPRERPIVQPKGTQATEWLPPGQLIICEYGIVPVLEWLRKERDRIAKNQRLKPSIAMSHRRNVCLYVEKVPL